MKQERDTLGFEKSKFASERKHQYEELKADQQRWTETKEKVEKMYTPPEDIVDLNIGGTHLITTSRSTLCSVKDSSLAAMFSGRHRMTMHNGRVFIDRDGEAFCLMLSFLRTGKVPMFTSQVQEHAFYDELDYWMVPTQPEIGNTIYGPNRTTSTISAPVDVGSLNNVTQAFDAEWCADTLSLEDSGKILKKSGT